MNGFALEVDNEQNYAWKFAFSVAMSVGSPSQNATLAETGWVWIVVAIGLIGSSAGTLREVTVTDNQTGNTYKTLVLYDKNPTQVVLKINEAKTLNFTFNTTLLGSETMYAYCNVFRTSARIPGMMI